ncbi:P-loop containing nucleoside triphosphate hydrolase protein [Colletotrichum caudatum]|nr:P-loop containing nucleoside triphosphate hydrolase protein [Colletotrichum caudatum]
MQLLDMDLPSNMVNYTSTAVSILAKLVILAIFSQYLGITLPFLATVVYFLQRFYLQTSRQIRLLGIEAKAPLYTHFSESVAGDATIRAFGWQAYCIQTWLTFILNLVVAVLAVVLLPRDWPRDGAVNFSNVIASYGPDAEPVLKRVSFSVQAGDHVAVCGRSGSGKTSLVLSLLQMTDLREGTIGIDGIDVSTLVPSGLRSCINVISQDPFLMPGTIRFNIDPLSAVSDDARITQALDRVGLSRHVQEQGGLGTDMDDKAWSAGQKQLLCMARTMLRRCKLLILDEAMSSVDSETEAVMQDVIDNEFRDCTVLAVMHRLKHVSRYDVVALLGDGKILEIGEPSSLIAGDGRFAELYRMSLN